MASVATILRTLEENLASACINAYGSIEGAPLPVPTPVIPPSGAAVVIDCGNLLIVRCASITSAVQGDVENCALVLAANLEVTITRCVVNLTDWGRPASRTKLTTDGLSLADDVSTLWYGVTDACRIGQLWTGFNELGCGDTKFRDFRPGAGGDIAWFTWSITVNVTSSLAMGNDPIVWQSGDPIDWQS